jgi:hypothetical protein
MEVSLSDECQKTQTRAQPVLFNAPTPNFKDQQRHRMLETAKHPVQMQHLKHILHVFSMPMGPNARKDGLCCSDFTRNSE